MKLVVGLGNPGQKYERTRHNAGFRAVDVLARAWDAPMFGFEKEWATEFTKIAHQDESWLLAKPQTFMNLSGKAVQSLVQFYKLDPVRDVVLLYDDLDLPLGTLRVSGMSSGGHNGVQSVFDHLGTQAIARVRIGIAGAERPTEMETADYVLQAFSTEEEKVLEETLKRIPDQLTAALAAER